MQGERSCDSFHVVARMRAHSCSTLKRLSAALSQVELTRLIDSSICPGHPSGDCGEGVHGECGSLESDPVPPISRAEQV